MGRSLKVHQGKIHQVKTALRCNGYFNQGLLAAELGLSQGTVSNFLNGKPVDWQNFLDLCEKLGRLSWRDIADLELDPTPAGETQETITPPSPPVLEYPEGLVKPGSPFYIDRPPNEERCYETLNQPGALIRIKAPRQMGKTSLLARLLQRAEQNGDRAVYLSLQLVESKDLTNTKTFIQWFCTQVTEELQLSDQLDQFNILLDKLSSKSACEKYFEGYLLPKLEQTLTLVLDEVDQVFETPDIYKNFFSLLRVIHEKGKLNNIWKRLRLIIAHSTEVYVQIDPNQSPFNVGVSILLPEFTATQVQDLAQRHHLDWSDSEVQQLMEMIGGHPFLVRCAMYHIACQEKTLAQVLQEAPTDTGIYSEHLRRQTALLNHQTDLANAMREVATSQNPISLKQVLRAKLQGLGLVKLQGDAVVPSCEVYRQYFRHGSLPA